MKEDIEKPLLIDEVRVLRDQLIDLGHSMGPDDTTLSSLDIRDLKQVLSHLQKTSRSIPR
jgi:hypothetical protein